MKPGDPKQLRQQRSAAAALKREIRLRFGWLDGAPAIGVGARIPADGSIPWLLFHRDKRFSPHLTTLTSEEMLRSVRGPSYLRRTFPRAFPRMAKDIEAWCDGHTAVADLLSSASTIPDPLSVLLSRSASARRYAMKITAAHPALEPLVCALIWRLPHDERAVIADLKLLGNIAPQLERVAADLEGQLRLLHLASLVTPAALIPLLDVLAHPAMATPLQLGEAIPFDAIREFARSPDEPPKKFPTIDIGETQLKSVLGFALRVAEMDKGEARACLGLFLDCFPRALLKPLAAWWSRWNDLRPHLEQLYRKPSLHTKRDRSPLAKKCLNLKHSIIELPDVAKPVFAATGTPWVVSVQSLLRALPSVLESRACRVEMLRYYNGRTLSKAARPVIAAMGRYFTTHPPERFRDLGPWATSFRGGTTWEVYEDRIAASLKGRSQLALYFEAMQIVLLSKPGDTGDLDALPALVAGTGCSAAAATLCLAIENEGLNCSGDHDDTYILAALDHAGDARSMPKLLRSLFEFQSEIDYDHEPIGIAVLEALRSASERPLYQRLLDEKDCRTLVYLTRLCSILDAPPPQLPAATARRARWMDRYPADFLPLLQALRSYLSVEEAKKRVATILGKEFPDPELLQNELDHIERVIGQKPTAGLEARAEKLRGWIAFPPEVSPVRLHRLGQKLQRAASDCRLDRWRSNIFDLAKEKLSARLSSFPDLDRWLGEPKLLRHALGVAALSASERKHPLRVLRAMRDPDCQNVFREAPENANFRKLLEAKGLDLAPWIDGFATQNFTLEDGSELQVALENDPMEILDMGYHFSTCLSPLGCNYFSVYANISDLNKRVVYGRTAGKVRARCLLALCEEGTVLVFHPYNHGIGEKFEEMITAFAESLATAIGTVVTPRGAVPTLVSNDWYDDGPIDVGRRFEFLRDGSDFRTELKTMEPENLRPRIFEEIAQLDALTIPYLIHLPEFDERQLLLSQIIPDIRLAENQLPERTLMRAAELAERGGEAGFAQQLIGRHARQFLLRRRDLDATWTTLWLLVKYEPSTALGVIRKLRGKGVRSWEQDRERNILAAAEAYYRLSRPGVAKRLFDRVKPRDFNGELKQLILSRRRELS